MIAFFAFPGEIRTVMYTIKPMESWNMTLRKALEPQLAFPSEEAAVKVMYHALRNICNLQSATKSKNPEGMLAPFLSASSLR